MALKVMMSSVRRGLADVRDSIAPVIKILRLAQRERNGRPAYPLAAALRKM